MRGRTRTTVAALIAASMAALAVAPAAAAAWGLDPTFGDAGVVRFAGLRASSFNDVAQVGGRIVAVGASYDGDAGVVYVAATTASGAPDSAFGGTGLVSREGFDTEVRPPHLDVTADGGVTAVTAGGNRVYVMQWLPDGTPNADFGGDGLKVLRAHASLGYNSPQVAVDRRGRVVVAAMTGGTRSSDVVVFRLRPGGGLDATFSRDGVRTIDDDTFDWIDALATDGQNRVVLATDTVDFASSKQPSALVRRWTSDGKDDLTFSGDGLVALQLVKGQGSLALDLEPSASGLSVALGRWGSAYGVVRLTPEGRPDQAFADAGVFSLNCQCVMGDADQRAGEMAFVGARSSGTADVLTRVSADATSVQIGEYDVVAGATTDSTLDVLVSGDGAVVVGNAYSSDPVLARVQ